jgi:hypothetical protein
MTNATTGDLFAALLAAHQLADHWIQTDRQATMKMNRSREGHLACAGHVAGQAAAKGLALGVLHLTGRRVSWRRACGALAIDAASHYWADRRHTLEALARAAGSGAFWDLGVPRGGHDDNETLGTGWYALDQAWHVTWLYIAALAAAGGG